MLRLDLKNLDEDYLVFDPTHNNDDLFNNELSFELNMQKINEMHER